MSHQKFSLLIIGLTLVMLSLVACAEPQVTPAIALPVATSTPASPALTETLTQPIVTPTSVPPTATLTVVQPTSTPMPTETAIPIPLNTPTQTGTSALPFTPGTAKIEGTFRDVKTARATSLKSQMYFSLGQITSTEDNIKFQVYSDLLTDRVEVGESMVSIEGIAPGDYLLLVMPTMLNAAIRGKGGVAELGVNYGLEATIDYETALARLPEKYFTRGEGNPAIVNKEGKAIIFSIGPDDEIHIDIFLEP